MSEIPDALFARSIYHQEHKHMTGSSPMGLRWSLLGRKGLLPGNKSRMRSNAAIPPLCHSPSTRYCYVWGSHLAVMKGQVGEPSQYPDDYKWKFSKSLDPWSHSWSTEKNLRLPTLVFIITIPLFKLLLVGYVAFSSQKWIQSTPEKYKNL